MLILQQRNAQRVKAYPSHCGEKRPRSNVPLSEPRAQSSFWPTPTLINKFLKFNSPNKWPRHCLAFCGYSMVFIIWWTHCPNLFVQLFLAHITQSFLWSKWCNNYSEACWDWRLCTTQHGSPKGSALQRFPPSKAMMMWLPCWACDWPLGKWPPTITGLFAPFQWTGGPDW